MLSLTSYPPTLSPSGASIFPHWVARTSCGNISIIFLICWLISGIGTSAKSTRYRHLSYLQLSNYSNLLVGFLLLHLMCAICCLLFVNKLALSVQVRDILTICTRTCIIRLAVALSSFTIVSTQLRTIDSFLNGILVLRDLGFFITSLELKFCRVLTSI